MSTDIPATGLDFIGFLRMELFVLGGYHQETYSASLYTGPVRPQNKRHGGAVEGYYSHRWPAAAREEWQAQFVRPTYVGEPLVLGSALDAKATLSSNVLSRSWVRGEVATRCLSARRKPGAPTNPRIRLGRVLILDLKVTKAPATDRDLTIVVPVWRARTGRKTLNAALSAQELSYPPEKP